MCPRKIEECNDPIIAERRAILRARSVAWRKANPGYSVKYLHRTGRTKPMSENPACASWLGIYIAENMLIDLFDNIERMPTGNHGFDIRCGDITIDVKSSCRRINRNNKNYYWGFDIDHNPIPDIFACVAFKSREDPQPEHLWLIPKLIASKFRNLCIFSSERGLKKWLHFERSFDKIISVSHEPLVRNSFTPHKVNVYDREQ